MSASPAGRLLRGRRCSTRFSRSWPTTRARQDEAEAVAAGKELAIPADALEAALARSLLRPLALQGMMMPMADPEWVALWDLAESRPGRVGYRFVEDATRAPETTRQLRDRAALALHAAVGPSPNPREQVEPP